jgi:hypothetical protein
MWAARTKRDLIIEVWEKLDCDSVGAVEIEAIETAVGGQFGESAVDSPMAIARIVADEGAELRHSEIMELFVRRRSEISYEPALADITELRDLPSVHTALMNLTELRRKYLREQDKKAVKELQTIAIKCKEAVLADAEKLASRGITRFELPEIAQWYTIWLQTPDIFEDWLELRRRAPEFREKFSDQFPST